MKNKMNKPFIGSPYGNEMNVNVDENLISTFA